MVDSEKTSLLNVRWLGRSSYSEVWDLQKNLFSGSSNYFLLVEHEPIYTIGLSGSESNLLVSKGDLGVPVLKVNRGGNITYHGPGQLVGYPILNINGKRGGGLVDTKEYVYSVEELIIKTLYTLGVKSGRLNNFPGVWIDEDTSNPKKIAAVGVRLSRGRSMHGFALNVAPDLEAFNKIVPCGIADKSVTSLKQMEFDFSMKDVFDALVENLKYFSNLKMDIQEVVWKKSSSDLSKFSLYKKPGKTIKEVIKSESQVPVRLSSRMKEANLEDGLEISARKPEWMKVRFKTDKNFINLKKSSKQLGLVTVCEEAGCPNIYDCWSEGTATFMLLGERCTRACGFCLVDTSKPLAVDLEEPNKIAKIISDLGLDFAVLTMVARDDLDDGGSAIVSETVKAIHNVSPDTGVEVLISDLAGSKEALEKVCSANPEILNHNLETVSRLQRVVRPNASYLRSLTLLARAKEFGMITKSGIIVGMGEEFEELKSTLYDLASVGVDIVTIGQYLRPTTNHLPISKMYHPDEFRSLKEFGESLGIAHVESSPLTRSSHHAGKIAKLFSTRVPISNSN